MTLVLRRAKKSWVFVILLLTLVFLVTRSYLPHLSYSNLVRHRHRGGCKVIAKGNLDSVLLRGTVLTSDGPLDDGYISVQSGRIVDVGTRYVSSVRDGATTVVDCTGSVISPGFINLHEHIEFSTVGPFKDLGERVKHRHDWRMGARNNTQREAIVRKDMIGDSIKWGELRHILSGTTSIVGGGMITGLARNLDFVAGLEADLLAQPDVWDVFPLDDAGGILRTEDCDYGSEAIQREEVSKYHKYLAHIGEGVDEEAANEFRCLSSETYDSIPMPGGGGLSTDIIAPNLAVIHALGLSEADFDLVAERGAHVVWSPRSNVFLYGKTLNVSYLLEAGINVALGTDWLPSGSATMSREATCAVSATQQGYKLTLEPKTVWEMMTINAAKAANFEEHIGSLAAGKLADIVVFRRDGVRDPYAQAAFAPAENIELVLRGGQVVVAEQDLHGLTRNTCEAVYFGQYRKIICVADEIGQSFADFSTFIAKVSGYPAILPGIPPYEPSCQVT
ncbi:putative Metal dependent amidohydrolase [Seiridium unicorne]|uniref:Metal dependent amidohydrolase n=1 Tax=Seiridium unicorne TaxID=138068 RepID=A0ABR2UL31_9PEZI